MSLKKLPLEEAARIALAAGLDDRRVAEALERFLSGRFLGGAGAVKAVHDWRAGLIGRREIVAEISSAPVGPYDQATLGEAAEHSAPPEVGRLLYQLVRVLGPTRGLELGTNIGVSAAYMAVAMKLNGAGRLVTLEASGPRLDVAWDLFSHLGLGNVSPVRGTFSETLAAALAGHGPIDLAYLDGHHQRDPTLSYFEAICGNRRPGCLVVLDDIRWSEDMLSAWETIRHHPAVAEAVDLSRLGLVVTS